MTNAMTHIEFVTRTNFQIDVDIISNWLDVNAYLTQIGILR
jgi:hypothetical protein